MPINPTGLNTFRSEFYFQRLIPQKALWICSTIQQAPPTYPSAELETEKWGMSPAFLLSYFSKLITDPLMMADRMMCHAPACQGTITFAQIITRRHIDPAHWHKSPRVWIAIKILYRSLCIVHQWAPSGGIPFTTRTNLVCIRFSSTLFLTGRPSTIESLCIEGDKRVLVERAWYFFLWWRSKIELGTELPSDRVIKGVERIT